MTVNLVCPYCGFSEDLGEELIPDDARWATCPQCGQRFEMPVPEQRFGFLTGTDDTDSGPDKGGLQVQGEPERRHSPWENRSEVGLFKGIYRTCKEVLISPEPFSGP